MNNWSRIWILRSVCVYSSNGLGSSSSSSSWDCSTIHSRPEPELALINCHWSQVFTGTGDKDQDQTKLSQCVLNFGKPSYKWEETGFFLTMRKVCVNFTLLEIFRKITMILLTETTWVAIVLKMKEDESVYAAVLRIFNSVIYYFDQRILFSI